MSKHVGILACSAEGAALCYRTLCAEAPARMGAHRHPEVSMHTHALAESRGFNKLAITGTKYLMTGPVYPETLQRFGITCLIPDSDDREKIDTIIFDELVNGLFTEESRLYFNEVVRKLEERGCDAVVLGCTEIPLLVNPDDCPLPTLDSTRLLARAALEEALKPG